MAENQEDRSTEDLSDEASPYRMEEARRKGQVAQSRELAGMGSLLAAGAVTYAMSPTIGTQIAEYMREVFRADLTARLNLGDNSILSATMMRALKVLLTAAAPACLIGFFMGALSSFVQVGSIFTTDPLQPDFSKIDPLQGFKRIFSLKQLVEGVRMCLKAAVVAWVAYNLIKGEIFSAPAQVGAEPVTMGVRMAEAGKSIFLSMVGVLGIFAAIDFFLQRREFMKGMRMTKQEAKQEFKEREGDPQIKARIRAVQREVARKRMMQAVKTADVIITNPTHIAIAIVYDRDKHAAPRVVAKGADFLAQKIKKVASDAGVPLVENVPLARTLFKTVKVGHQIPRALYQAVAEVLAHVYRLKNRRL